MKYIRKMLSGEGELEYQAQKKVFRDAIPDMYSPGLTIEERAALHPAYSGDTAWRLEGFDYRRAHYMHGPQSKEEHEAFAREQAKTNEADYEAQMQIAWSLAKGGA